ncbi:hypothetical protein K7X08_006214 [Anisodus acutangulus]|uniref:Uncharacterized protein n=1 Tax=Anisodus acutangulus TaxID=402998 RepID=A0A9Q1RNP0_9SOLA|nr:hypothetical protein K7X08_006214 [Anisodus acutangulus]
MSWTVADAVNYKGLHADRSKTGGWVAAALVLVGRSQLPPNANFQQYLIALGTGGLKSSVSGFGTDQFDEKDEKEKSQMAYFFNRFFLFISIGTLAAVTVLVYVQDKVGRSWAYGICCISMLIAIIIFFSGTKKYRYKRSSGSPIVQIFQVILAATRKRNMDVPYDVGMLYETNLEASRIQHSEQFRFLDKAAIVAEGDFEDHANSAPNPWKLCTVTRVEEKVTGSNGGEGWLADNINYGRLDCFYGLLAILGVINFVLYLFCAVWFKPRKSKSAIKMETMNNGNVVDDKC